MRIARSLAVLSVLVAVSRAQTPAPAGPETAPGVQVVAERLGGERAAHSLRARLLSLAVERGETLSPLLAPGLFRATCRTTVTLPVRERYRFRAEGRGSLQLLIDGEKVLDGALRPGKPIETAQAARLKKGDNQLVVVFESSAVGEGQFRLLWAAPDTGFEPIPPERLRAARDEAGLAADRLAVGQQLFTERHCVRCHLPDGQRPGESAYGELDVVAPDLRAVGGRLQRDYLAAWLRDPAALRPDATMPHFALGEQDCADVATWLASLGSPLAMPPFAPDAAATGEALFARLGCVGCHTAPREDPVARALGDRIALAHVPGKWHPPALVDFLIDPRRDHPGVRMPDLGLTRDEAIALAAFLVAAPGPALPVAKGVAERGRRLVQQHGCRTCHELDVPEDAPKWPELRSLRGRRGCLADAAEARGRAPDLHLDVGQRTALLEFLPFAATAPFRRAPLDYLRRNLTAQRCTACHPLDGAPSVWAQVAERAAAAAPVPAERDPRAFGLPALTWTGAKLQPSWLAAFLRGDEPSPRPWLRVRMPHFRGRADALAAGLLREHGYGAADEPLAGADVESAGLGERLVRTGTGFGCVLCHALAGAPPTQVADRQGIDLRTARGRLRHEYFTRWLADPPRLDPDARMPKFADANGKTQFTDVLGGDAKAQFEAIWQFLTAVLARR